MKHGIGRTPPATWGAAAALLTVAVLHGATWFNARAELPRHALAGRVPLESFLEDRVNLIEGRVHLAAGEDPRATTVVLQHCVAMPGSASAALTFRTEAQVRPDADGRFALGPGPYGLVRLGLLDADGRLRALHIVQRIDGAGAMGIELRGEPLLATFRAPSEAAVLELEAPLGRVAHVQARDGLLEVPGYWLGERPTFPWLVAPQGGAVWRFEQEAGEVGRAVRVHAAPAPAMPDGPRMELNIKTPLPYARFALQLAGGVQREGVTDAFGEAYLDLPAGPVFVQPWSRLHQGLGPPRGIWGADGAVVELELSDKVMSLRQGDYVFGLVRGGGGERSEVVELSAAKGEPTYHRVDEEGFFLAFKRADFAGLATLRDPESHDVLGEAVEVPAAASSDALRTGLVIVHPAFAVDGFVEATPAAGAPSTAEQDPGL